MDDPTHAIFKLRLQLANVIFPNIQILRPSNISSKIDEIQVFLCIQNLHRMVFYHFYPLSNLMNEAENQLFLLIYYIDLRSIKIGCDRFP
jgi:hypothetical protein